MLETLVGLAIQNGDHPLVINIAPDTEEIGRKSGVVAQVFESIYLARIEELGVKVVVNTESSQSPIYTPGSWAQIERTGDTYYVTLSGRALNLPHNPYEGDPFEGMMQNLFFQVTEMATDGEELWIVVKQSGRDVDPHLFLNPKYYELHNRGYDDSDRQYLYALREGFTDITIYKYDGVFNKNALFQFRKHTANLDHAHEFLDTNYFSEFLAVLENNKLHGYRSGLQRQLDFKREV